METTCARLTKSRISIQETGLTGDSSGNMKKKGLFTWLKDGSKMVFMIAAGIFMLALPVCLRGEDAPIPLKLPSLFGNNMVLQQQQAVPVWGWAAPGQAVTVTFGTQRKTTIAGQDGRWEIRLDSMKAGGPFEMTIAAGKTIILKNVMVGEVWLCSGQSNMEMSVKISADAEREMVAAKYPDIRLFVVPRTPQTQPQSDCKAAWAECSPATVGSFSAVGYYFGRKLNPSLNVPIGLIQSAFGNTGAEMWICHAALKENPNLKYYAKRFDMMALSAQTRYDQAIQEWRRNGGKGAQPPLPPELNNLYKQPTTLYNGMIAPLIPYAIRGVIWYQGESNDWRAYQYRKLFTLLIQDWRRKWNQGDFPFLFVQIANNGAPPVQPESSTRAELREAQTMALSLPNTGMAVAIDVGDRAEHPKNKQDVGLRLALWALATTYGQKDLVYSGPLYEANIIEGNQVRLKFKNLGGGLVAKGGPLKQFSIAGDDRKFVWADTRIDGETIIVSSPNVAKPTAVRYAWANNPEGCNLYNAAGLPASPFRTDEWPGITVNNK